MSLEFAVKGYKCISDEIKLQISPITILWGPRGSGKSSLLESLTITLNIINGAELKESLPEHIANFDIKSLLTLQSDVLTLTLNFYDYKLTLSFNRRGTLWNVSLNGPLIKTIDANDISDRELCEIFRALKDRKLIESLSGESKKFVQNVWNEIDRLEGLKNAITYLQSIKVIYVSAHRPSPREYYERGQQMTSIWSSEGLHVLSALRNIIQHRVSQKQKLEMFEKYLNELQICREIPCIEYSEEGVKIEQLEFGNLSSGERNIILLLLASIETPQGGLLIIEEPELGLHIEAFRELLKCICKIVMDKKAHLIMSTHSLMPLDVLRELVGGEEINPSNLGLYYVRRVKNGPTNLIKLIMDKQGRILRPSGVHIRDHVNRLKKVFHK